MDTYKQLLQQLYALPLPLNIFIEMLVWAFLFEVCVERTMKPVLKAILPSIIGEKGWKAMSKKPAAFTQNEQLETVVLFAIGSQHTFAGCCIVLGALWGDLKLVRHGMLCEAGWEMLDLVCLVGGIGPYAGDAIKKELKNVMIYHHLPGIMSAPLLIYSNLHSNPHAQIVAACMILVGGVGVLTGALGFILKAKGAVLFVLLLELFETFVVFSIARFLVFPLEVYKLLLDLYVDHQVIAGIVAFACLMMMVFNVVIMGIKVHKAVKAVKSYGTPDGDKKILMMRQSSSTSFLAAGVSLQDENKLD